MVERFCGDAAKSRRFGGRSSSPAECRRFLPCVVGLMLGFVRTIVNNYNGYVTHLIKSQFLKRIC